MEQHASGPLVRRCAVERDARLWEEFQSRFGCLLTAGVRRALRRSGVRFEQPDLEDHLQEVYCKLLEKGGRSLRRCRGAADPAIGVYLGRVAETVVIDRLRAESAVKRGRNRQVLLPPHVDYHPVDLAVDPALTPEEQALSNERRRVFLSRCREAVGPRFPKRDFRVLVLAFLVGMTSREISRSLGGGMTPSSVDSLIHRARKRLAARGLEVPRRKEGLRRRSRLPM